MRADTSRIFLKLDNLQPGGSFKTRGIGNYILEHLRSLPAGEEKAKPHFYTSSGGNAGLACVRAATDLGYPSTVVVPLSTKAHMVEKIRIAGASEVIQHGETWFQADTYLRENILSKDAGGVYVPPFDHPKIWSGNATVSEEIREDLGEVDVVVCSVGGGGLFCGVMQGLEGSKGTDGKPTRVIVVETEGAESLHKSIQAKELVTLPGITSIATSLGAVRVAAKALECGLKENVTSLVVSDEQACRACVKFAEDERLIVEPACGATVAVIYEGILQQLGKSNLNLGPESKVVLEVCGGRNIGIDLLEEWKKAYCQ